MNCEEIKPNLVAYLHNELSREEIAQLEQHIKTCGECTEHLKLWRRNDKIVAETFQSVKPSPHFAQKVMTAIPPRRFSYFERLLNSKLTKIAAVYLLVLTGSIFGLWRVTSFLGESKPQNSKTTFIETPRELTESGEDNEGQWTRIPVIQAPINNDKALIMQNVYYAMEDKKFNIKVTFNSPVSPNVAKEYISVEPQIENLHIERSGERELILGGEFKAGKVYGIKFAKGLPSEGDPRLQNEITQVVRLPDFSPYLKFKSEGNYISTKGNLLLPTLAMNASEVDLKVSRVYKNNIVHFAKDFEDTENHYSYRRHHYYSDESEDDPTKEMGYEVIKKKIKLNSEKNVELEYPLDLQALLGDKLTGPTILTLSTHKCNDDENYYARQTKLILVTDIGISVKKSDNDLLVWLHSIKDTTPVAFASVVAYSRTNQSILEGVTDAEGIVHFKDVSCNGDHSPYLIVASKGEDISYINLEKSELSNVDFDVDGKPYLRKGYEAFVYIDRGVYRPGEDIHIRAVVKTAEAGLPEGLPLEFKIIKPDNRTLRKLKANLSEFSTSEITFNIPDYVPTGLYSAKVFIPGQQKEIGNVNFQVEEFMPARMKVAISTSDKRFELGETAIFNVKGGYLFGQPAANLRADARYAIESENLYYPKWKEYIFGDKTKDFSQIKRDLKTAMLNSQGETDFAVEIPKELKPPSALKMYFTATIKEVGGRSVSSSATVSIDPYPFYIGLKALQTEEMQTDKSTKFECVTIRPDGELLTEGKKLTVSIKKVIWNTVLKNIEGRYRYESEREEIEIKKLNIKTSVGEGTFSFTPKDWGSYIVRISDTDSGSSTSLEFYSSGYGYTPWAMKKPDKIELVSDKKIYQPGETASVTIKSPISGRLLLFGETDHINFYKTLDIEGNTATISIPIEETLAPTFYVSATIIKKVEEGDKLATYRAYGVMPIAIDIPQKKLAVSITAQQEVRPDSKLDITIDVKDINGQGTPSELSLALVDEGICQLTNFKTPDPYSFFFDKRRLGISTFDIYSFLLPEYDKKNVGTDSEEGGDGDSEAKIAKRLLNPISVQRVKSTVLWMSNVKTDSSGQAQVSLQIPEFTGSLRLMVVAVGKDLYGSAWQNIIVRRPFIITSSLPRFVSTGDEFIAPITLFNNTKVTGVAKVKVEVEGKVNINGATEVSVEVPHEGEKTIFFKFTCEKLPGAATISFTANFGEESVTDKTTIPMRPPAPFYQITGSGLVEAGKSANFALPNNMMTGTDKVTLIFSSLPTIRLGGALQYVLRYPYGCVEQTTSTTFPLVYLKDAVKLIEPYYFVDREVDAYVQAGIYRLLSMQTSQGGLGFWPGDNTPYAWGSVYGAHCLVEAKKAGYDVPEESLKALLNYLQDLLNGKDLSHENTLATDAYACYVLALAGNFQRRHINTLAELWDKLPTYSKYNLASAMMLAGNPRQAHKLIGNIVPEPNKRRDTGGILNSPTRETAIVLLTLLDIEPQSPNIPVLVEKLNNSIIDAPWTATGHWTNTQDNGFALIALGKYANKVLNKKMGSRKNDFSTVVKLNKEPLGEFTSMDSPHYTVTGAGGKTVDIITKGEGTLYYYWTAEGVPISGNVPEEDTKIKVRRRFLTTDGKELNTTTFQQGKVYIVELSIDNDTTIENMAVVDMLPGGLEIENPRLANTEKFDWIKANAIEPVHIDIRDDRLILFVNLNTTERHYYRYVVRAITSGTFILPPVSASCMYDPSIQSINGVGKVKVE